jgi:hypothetical protein
VIQHTTNFKYLFFYLVSSYIVLFMTRDGLHVPSFCKYATSIVRGLVALLGIHDTAVGVQVHHL